MILFCYKKAALSWQSKKDLNKYVNQEITFLDKELQQILPNAENGRTYADKLVQVAFKDGQIRWEY